MQQSRRWDTHPNHATFGRLLDLLFVPVVGGLSQDEGGGDRGGQRGDGVDAVLLALGRGGHEAAHRDPPGQLRVLRHPADGGTGQNSENC